MVHHFVPNFMRELPVILKTIFLSARLQKMQAFHLPQFIISWKDSGSQGKSQCVKAKGRNRADCLRDHRALRWYVFEKPSCYHDGHSHMGSGILWKILVTQHSPALHQEMQLEIVLCKEEGNLLILHRNASEFSGPEVIWDGPKGSGNMFSGQMSPHFSLFLGKTDNGFYVPKMKKTIQIVTNEKCKTSLWGWYGGASVPMAWVICIYVKVPLMRRLMLEFWRDICCRQDDDFSQELHVHFSRTMPGLILHKLQQHGFVGIECMCLTGLPAVQICLLLKMYGASWRGESDNDDHGLLSRPRSCIHQDWAKISLTKLQQLITSVLKRLKSVIKRKGDVPQW